MSDLIDRQDAIKAVLVSNFSACTVYGRSEKGMATAKELIQMIKNLPSAQQDTDEWCTDCKEYDHERHCCPRWNRVIRETLREARPCDTCKYSCLGTHDDPCDGCHGDHYKPMVSDCDGTLTVTVPKGTKVTRVLVEEDETHWGGLFYPEGGK